MRKATDGSAHADAGEPHVRGRITAESFRSLTARLRNEPHIAPAPEAAVVWPEIPDLFKLVAERAESPAAEPAAAPVEEAVVEAPVVEAAEAQARSITAAEVELPAFELPAFDETPLADIAIPAFVPGHAPWHSPVHQAEAVIVAERGAVVEPEPMLPQEAAAAEPAPIEDHTHPPEAPLIGLAPEPQAELAPEPQAETFDRLPLEDLFPSAEPEEPLQDPLQSAPAALEPESAASFAPEPVALEEPVAAPDQLEPAEAAAPEESAPEPVMAEAAQEQPLAEALEVEISQPFEMAAEPLLVEIEAEPLPTESAAEPLPVERADESVPLAIEAEPLPVEIEAEPQLVAAALETQPEQLPDVSAQTPDAAADVFAASQAVEAESEDGDEDERKLALKALAIAIHARPSSAERAAFLRDMAALLASGAEAGGDVPPQAPAAEPLAASLASRLGPSQPLLRKAEPAKPDPFSKPAAGGEVERNAGDEAAGAHALSLLDMMSSSSVSQPQERALAADTLLRLIPRVPAKALAAIVERVAIMEVPPPLLLARLVRDPRAEIVAPLVERSVGVTDQDLITAAAEGSVTKCRMIARRRTLSALVADHLIATEDPSVLLTLIRNPGAVLSHDAYFVLADFAAKHTSLLAPLATRAELPAPVAFELFWHLPGELRRFVFSRFLTDSETLNKILKITRAAEDVGEPKFARTEDLEKVVEMAMRGRLDQAARLLGQVASVDEATAARILSDSHGEPVTVVLKAVGLQRSKLAETLSALRSPSAGVINPERSQAELENIFDTLSFNKARILLTYWDWFILKKGPYSPHH